MTNSKPGRDSDQFALRFPDGMRDRIKDAAASSNRSMNAEIIDRLEKSFVELEDSIRNVDKNISESEKVLAAIQRTADVSDRVLAQLAANLPTDDPIRVEIDKLLTPTPDAGQTTPGVMLKK